MRVSVIVPNYNHEQFLQRRIESILNQTYSNFEVIILDDTSTDNSRFIIEQYRQHSKVSNIVYNITNSGSVFRQWQKGISLAAGELIWMAESDDWCENNFLETLVPAFENNPACVVAFAQSYCVGDNGEVKWQSQSTQPKEYIDGRQFIEKRLIYGCTIFNASMALFKKQYAVQVPDDYTSFKLCGDWFFWINMVRYGDVFISSKLLNYYRRVDGSLTSQYYASGYNFIDELRMFQLIRKQKKESRSLINSSIFNRYNSFKRSAKKFTLKEKRKVMDAFNACFGNTFSFKMFLLKKQTLLIQKKLQVRMGIISAKLRL